MRFATARAAHVFDAKVLDGVEGHSGIWVTAIVELAENGKYGRALNHVKETFVPMT
jgi:hypothetical protein